MADAEGYRLVDFNSHLGGREYFPDDFEEYVDRELNCLAAYSEDNEDDIFGWVFWSREDHESDDIVDLKTKIEDVLPKFIFHAGDFVLVQFWAPIKTTEGRFSLTTQNQPFALRIPVGYKIVESVYMKGLCEYRMISKDYKFYMDGAEEELGVPGRVFKHRWPESTPNVKYYSMREHPLRDRALRCQVTQSWAFPVFEPSAQMCVGVLEFVTTTGSPRAFQFSEYDYYDYIFEDIKAKGLIVLVPHAHHYNYNQLITGKTQALNEINEVLTEVSQVHDLALALAWTSCKVDMACRALVNDDVLFACCGYCNYCYFNFSRVNLLHHIKRVQGVAGRAFSSPNVLLCKDSTQLSIIDYPLAHYARDAKLSCFAICLQSSCTGNDLYVLEFFMPPPSNIARGDSETTLILRKILETMKKKFQTFKLASGKELGEELRIEEIHFQNGEKLNSLQMSQTTTILPGPEPSQSGGEMMLLDSSDQQSMDALNNGRDVPSAEQSNIDATCSQEKGIKKMPKRVHNKTGVKIEIPLEDILRTSKMSLQDAANNLIVSRSTLKRVCRDYDIQRWPPRMKNMVGCCQPSESSPCVDHNQIPHLSSDLPSSQASATVVHTNPNNKVIQGANTVTVRSNYINDIIKFRLSLPSRLVELQQQIAKRLNLETGTYCVKYEDEDNYKILIACDEDLQDCISTSRSLGSTSRSLGSTSIMLFIEPK